MGKTGLVPEGWAFYEVHGLFRLSGIAQQIDYRDHHRQASFDAEDYDRLSGRAVAQARWPGQLLRGAGMCGARVICGSLSRHRAIAIHCLAGGGVFADPDIRPEWNEFDHLALHVGRRGRT